MHKTIVKKTRKMGRGVFAARNFSKGEIAEISPCIVFESHDMHKVDATILRFYVFSTGDTRTSCLALGVGSLFNHCGKTWNVRYKYIAKSKTLIFTTARSVKKGEQLFIDYGYDPVTYSAKFYNPEKVPELPAVKESWFRRYIMRWFL